MSEDFIPSTEVWGKLLSLNPNFPSIDLKGETIVCGRSNKDMKITCTSISGKHFTLTRSIKENIPIVTITDTSTNGTFLDSQTMKSKKLVLAPQTDISLLNPKTNDNSITYTFQPINAEDEEERIKGPQTKYNLGRVIGTGSFGKVRLAFDKETNELFALKVINKDLVFSSSDRKNVIMDEVNILQKIKHKNVIGFRELFETKRFLYLVIEYAGGGELYERVCYNPLDEDRARDVISQCLDALKYLHAMNIAHRDIKPENILLQAKDNFVVKISDFGLSRLAEGSSVMKTKCGSPDYVAPEVIKNEGSYGVTVDMWSLGIVTFVSLLSHFPEGLPDVNFGSKGTNLSFECRDFITNLLKQDPSERMTAEAAMEHPWIKGTRLATPVIEPETPKENEPESTTFQAQQMERFEQENPGKIFTDVAMPTVFKATEQMSLISQDAEMVSVYKRPRNEDEEMSENKKIRK